MPTENNNTNADRFTKVNDELIALGLPPRLVMLYGRIVYHTRKDPDTGKDRLCYRKWSTLGEEIGVKDRTTVYRLLLQLKALKLVDWKRHGRHTNQYWALVPDVAWLQRQRLQGRNVSDVARTQPRREVVLLREAPKRKTPTPTPPPGICAADAARACGSALAKIPQSADGWFDQFWSAYSCWRNVAKKAAQKAFLTKVKTVEVFELVMHAIQRQTPTMMARESRYRPHAATWLNQERWLDEPSQPPRKGPSKTPTIDELAKSIEAFGRTRR